MRHRDHALLATLGVLLALVAPLPSQASAEVRTPVVSLTGEATLDVEGPLALVGVVGVVGRRAVRRLALVRDGAVEPLPIPATAGRLDADIGTDAAGRPTVVLSRCTPGCDLYALRPGIDTAPHRIAGASTTDDERDPSVSDGTLAFDRSRGNGLATVLVRPLAAPRRVASQRLPGAPAADCTVRIDAEGSCRALDPAVVELELAGTRLAEVVVFRVAGQGGYGTQQLREVDVRHRSSVLVARSTYGEGGQALIGPSFADSWLSWHRSCFGDPSGCVGVQGGAFRFRAATGTYEHAGDAYEPLSGYAALPGGGSLQVQATTEPLGADGPAALVRTGPLAWRRLAAGHVL